MILLDTHVLVWLSSQPSELSSKVGQFLASQAGPVQVSAVTAWEIALLVKRGRLKLPLEPAPFYELALEHHRIVELALTTKVLLASVALPDIHNDPFDRILIAECMTRGLTLLSKDRIIPTYPGIKVIW